MGWVLRLVETGVEGPLDSVDVLEIDRPGNLDDLADLGLRLPDGKQLLSQVQQAVVASPMPGSCRPTAGMPGLRCRMPGQRLSASPDCHPVRHGHGSTATLPLCQLSGRSGWD